MLDSYHLQILERSLDAATLRHQMIANNMANIDTPHYKSKQVVFEDLLQQELAGGVSGQQRLAAYRTDSRHIPFANASGFAMPQVISNGETLMQTNGNDVDMEYEMNQLAKNQIWFNGLSQITAGSFQKLKTVIQGGGK
ncbi:flagellar basal body rod protein FlgB [Brevibacillus sp. TJ4]|uniref:flagellar basal body rod protein FlgB n=1 Tax=Brevibacillus sp. TJ4 TaxID=3234853 RepID=UPI0037D8B81F